MNTTSESLLLRLQQNANQTGAEIDQSAWETFVSLYSPLMFYWARKVGLGQADAADLVQEVFSIVFRRLPDFRYDRGGSFRGWLRTVTLNKFREQHRKKSPPLRPTTDSILEHLASVPEAESTWDIDYSRMLLQQAMQKMECDFEPATWQALSAVMSGELTVELASEKFDVSSWTIYSARSRLMRRLREQLDGLME